MKNLYRFLLISAPIVSLYFFFPSLNYYFFQDDWFLLDWIQTQNLLSFFNFRTDIIYWRPFSMPLFFALNFKVFNLNPLGYHVVLFTIFALLIFSVYFLFKILTKDKLLSAVATFLYATWSIHFISLGWLSTVSYIIGPLFMVVTFVLFVKFVENKKNTFWLLSFIVFLVALASTEFAIMLPFILFAWGYFYKKKAYSRVLIPFFVSDLILITLRFLIFPIPAKGVYAMHLDSSVVSNFAWYVLWAFGYPESFKELTSPSFAKKSIDVLFTLWQVSLPATLLGFLSLVITVKTWSKNMKTYIFSLIWFILGLAPIILLTDHSYPLYISFAGIGILLVLVSSFKSLSKIYLLIFVSLWLVANFKNLQFTRSTHWVSNQQALSRAYVTFTYEKVKDIPEKSAFLFRPAEAQFAARNNFVIDKKEDMVFALNFDSAMRVIYNNRGVKSFYSDSLEELESLNIPEGISLSEITPTANP